MQILETITFIELGLASINVSQLLLFTLKASPTQDDGAYGSLGQPLFPSPSFKLPEDRHTPWPNNAENSTRY